MKWKVEWSRRPLTLTLGALIGLLLVCAPAEERVIGIWSISLWKAASLQPLLRLLPPEGRGLGVRGGAYQAFMLLNFWKKLHLVPWRRALLVSLHALKIGVRKIP